jgi:hypothetical protein
MAKRTWHDTKGHHWFDKLTRRKCKLWDEMYSNFTTPMTGEEHVQAHQDTKEHGVMGAISRFEANRWSRRGK